MKQLNEEELRDKYIGLLNKLDDYCRTEKIDYYLAYGTLLGAIRHNGFIPWDDDVDVFMLRTDYQKLIQNFNQKSLTSDHFAVLHYTNNSDVKSRMAYLVDTNTLRKPDYEDGFNSTLGINIDIFPVDKVPNSGLLRFVQRNKISILQLVFTVKNTKHSPHRGKIKNFALSILKTLFKPIDIKRVIEKMDDECQKYNTYQDFEKCNCYFSPYDQKKSFLMRDFSQAIDHVFESTIYKIPIGYNDILTKTYGDYMVPPPMEKRLPHNDHMLYYEK